MTKRSSTGKPTGIRGDHAAQPVRNRKGQYEPDSSGNYRGRPPKRVRHSSKMQITRDVLLAFEQEMTVTIDGKRKKVPAIMAIYEKLVRTGLAGDVRCLLKAIDLRQQIISEREGMLLRLQEQIIKTERSIKENPEDATDILLAYLEGAKRAMEDPLHGG